MARIAGAKGLLVLAVLGAALFGFLQPALAQSDEAYLDVVPVEGVIDGPTAEYLNDRIEAAQDDAVAVVVQLDTPGGLDIAMRDVIGRIMQSEIPVVVWVAPQGARAASAGTFIAYAAHLTYMAAATELGAATPVNLSGESLPEGIEEKAVNDAVAFITELARERGRDVDFAEAAVRDAAAIGVTEAVERGVVDGQASSLSELLQAIDGAAVDLANGEVATLDTYDEAGSRLNVTVRFQEMGLLQRLQHALTSPEVAFLLILAGAFGIIFELYNPGIGLAGILGAAALFMGFYGLSVLPTNWLGVLLVVFAVVLLLVDLHTGGLGAWTAAGLVLLVVGGLMMFSGAEPPLRLSPWAIVAAVAFTLLFFVSVMTAALRVRLRRPITGEESIVGAIGEAKTDIAPEGTVVTKGTLWRARTMETGIAAGSKVQVKATEGLVLLVEPFHEHEEPEAAMSSGRVESKEG
ncbi:MAG TPA: nodulation protein NfeD [Actinomycetota bacterium]|nr:nodulation protein NfeD [Actinomycetota bacterium]